MANELVTRFVRIHPRAPKKGYRARIHSVYGIPFDEARGWYEVSFRADQLRLLKNIRNETDNPDSKPVFQVCTMEERKQIEADEKRAKEPQGEQVAAVDLNKAENDSRYLEDRSRGRNQADLTSSDLRRSEENDSDVRDLAPPVPAAPANAVDGATPKPRRGRPPKAKPVQ